MNIPSLAAAALLVASIQTGAFAAATPQPAGGSNERPSVEGCVDQTLFNGIWRLKVTKSALGVNPEDDGFKSWTIGLEIRNGKNAQTAPSDTGWDEYPQLAFSDGTTLDMASVYQKVNYQKRIFYRELPPGGVATATLYFRLEGEDADKKPVKLLVAIQPKGPNGSFGYSVPSPSFRVRLDCSGGT